MKDVLLQDTPTVQSQHDASIALAHDIELTEEQGVCQKLNWNAKKTTIPKAKVTKARVTRARKLPKAIKKKATIKIPEQTTPRMTTTKENIESNAEESVMCQDENEVALSHSRSARPARVDDKYDGKNSSSVSSLVKITKSGRKKELVLSPKKNTILLCNIPDIHHYSTSDLSVKEKIDLVTWQVTLLEQGVTGMFVSSLEMIIKFSKEIVREHSIDVPPRMTWMDGLSQGDSSNPLDITKYGLKILFVLMCSPRATNKKLKSLDDFLNGSEFSLDSVSSMSVQQIAEKIRQMGMQNKNALFIQQAFQKIKHGPSAGKIPDNAYILKLFDGISMKIALLVIQYVYGKIQVSYLIC